MAYVAWSVVFGEQPTASKWNILGTNDASFNDGTGIADDAILARHLANGIVVPNNLDLDPADTRVITDQSTTSTSYTDLTTSGPAATVTVGANGLLLVLFGCGIYATATLKVASVALSGANTVAANDDWAIRKDTAAFDVTSSRAHLFTGLTPGSTVATMKYKTASGTANFFQRWIVAIPL